MAWMQIVLKMVGAEIESVGYLREGQAQEEAYNYNAQVAESEAQAVAAKGEYDVSASRAKAQRLMASQRALYAKAGVDLTEGSPLLVMAASAEEAEREAMAIRYNADVQSTRYQNQAQLYRFYGKQALQAGKMKAASSFLRALATQGDTGTGGGGSSGGSWGYGGSEMANYNYGGGGG